MSLMQFTCDWNDECEVKFQKIFDQCNKIGVYKETPYKWNESCDLTWTWMNDWTRE